MGVFIIKGESCTTIDDGTTWGQREECKKKHQYRGKGHNKDKNEG